MNRLIAPLLLLTLLLAALPARSEEPLTVFGVRPGMTAKEVRGALGEPAVDAQGPAGRIWSFRKGERGQDDPRVFFDSAGVVTFVMGSRLQRGGDEVLKSGASAEALRAALGDNAEVTGGVSGASVCRYPALKLTAILAGRPASVRVFGLGQEPSVEPQGP